MFDIEKYEKIIQVICNIKGIRREELYKILQDRECKYLLFLLLKKYRCTDIEKLKKDFFEMNKRRVNYNTKKAEEKFFINKNFRDVYFEIQGKLEKLP